MSGTRAGALLAELVWTEVAPRLEAGAVAVLPVGAAAKEHGPHLTMDTDFAQAEALGALLAETEDVLVWPAVGYGHYPAFVDYAGSTSLDAPTFEATVAQLLEGLLAAGARAALVLDTGVSTIGPIDRAVGRFDASSRVAACHIYRSPAYEAARGAVLEQPRGGHADEAETSIMLHLLPDRVRLAEATAWTQAIGPGRWSPSDPASPRYSPSGVFGDPTLATAAKGERLVAAILTDLRSALNGLR